MSENTQPEGDTMAEPVNTVARIDYAACKALKAAASTEDDRPLLNFVHVGRGVAEATNGHVLCRIPVVDEQDAPLWPTLPDEVKEMGWLVHRDALGLVKSKNALEIDLATGQCIVVGKGDAYPLELPHAHLNGDEDVGTYPDTLQVMPEVNGKHRKVRLAGEILKRLSAIAGTGKAGGALTLYVPEHGNEGHVQTGVRFHRRGEVDREGVAMPMRILD